MTETIASLLLSDLAKPRQSVFGRGQSDTVAEIADLPKLNTRAFFGETYITEGMGVLLRQVFDRLMARSDQGVFRLKQAMGGGKTHNLLAAALLAREPADRKVILQRVGVSVDDRNIRVAAFSGRETDTSDFLWVTLFRALGCEHRWERSNDVPGPSTWARVIGEEPALILLDELPPFFVSLGAKVAGPSTTEADRLALALANLMNAIVSGRLPAACLVISDLAGAWGEGSQRIQQAIDNANEEVGRGALDITPVRLDSIELYSILQSRLFEGVADEPHRRSVGQAYAQSLRTAVQQGAIPESYERWAQEISQSYPFHPGLHELFARFRENPGFQQTREMLRLARRMVAQLWETKQADRAILVHPHELDFADQDVAATLERINPSLSNARGRDVANLQHNAVAEALSRELGNEIATDAAKLVVSVVARRWPECPSGPIARRNRGLPLRAQSRCLKRQQRPRYPARRRKLVSPSADRREMALP